MTATMSLATLAQTTAPLKPLTAAQLRKKVKPKCIVLWPYRGAVEEGTILFVQNGKVDLIWLEGYKSRNDTVEIDEILAIHDKAAPEHSLFPFTGKGFLTEAGVKWKAEHPDKDSTSR